MPLSQLPCLGVPLTKAPIKAQKTLLARPPSLGAKVVSDSNGDAKLAQVFDGGAALAAGLSAGDTIVAVDGLRVNAANLERRLKNIRYW
ncbi:MAG: PDZ domain-containing protein [Gammaproteobacteria bacterium]|nr:PDZ domain-containing protein [Gammaproteobacteria bacterium]